ncbi:MAG: imidazole glycerol phosphate synthase subunit HisH [Thermoprotei archaeon]|nr:MAG: imidazole glycerol phosphate synthase subunit HisH [Thermoprotei archaeon]
MKVAIVNYGVGNLRGVKLGVERAGGEAVITERDSDLREADAIVLPGVGAFRDAMARLKGLEEALREEVASGKPLLGICLGLQLLFTESTERGTHSGLDLIKGRVVRLPSTVKVPHMGWNTVNLRRSSKLVEEVEQGSYVYFVHSYYAEPLEDVTVAVTEYGVAFPSIIEKPPLYATQFHPEKSGKVGLRILRNFLDIARR